MDNRKTDKPMALDAYESMAESYSKKVLTKSYNAYLERPATLSLLPNVQGMHVLDAGCGPGQNIEWLLDHGATVVGIDVSPKMLKLARERLGDRGELRRTDLRKPLPFIKDSSFDLILSSLVFTYIFDWHSVFKEFFRILRPGGEFVFSTAHPYDPAVLRVRENYFNTQRVEWLWRGFDKPVLVPSYHRPLTAMVEPLVDAGFQIKKLIEPQPTEEFRKVNPEDYEEVLTRPTFICFKTHKPDSAQ